MPKLPKLEFAKKMVLNYRDDDFTLWIIEGNLRIGKSAMSCKGGLQVSDYFWGDPPVWDSVEPFMGWHPAEVVEKWMNVEERQPYFIWDDAGMWLFSLDWANPLMVAIQKYMNVVATDYNNLILTTPNVKWILSKIAGMPGMRRIKVIKRYGSKTRDSESRKFSRIAVCYEPWKSPDLKTHGVYKRFYDKFSCKLPQPLYDIYQPIRVGYAKLAKQEIKRQLRLRSTIGRIQNLKMDAKLRRLEREEEKIQADLAKELEYHKID
jgi:hypothetical protein